MNTKPSHVVEAAGGIPYRWVPGCTYREVEVCLVHRPKYDDWSWPKGKLEAGESNRHAAVREIEEECGVPVALGPSIGEEEYLLGAEGQQGKRSKLKSGVTKHVTYWMAEPLSTEESEGRIKALGPVKPAKKSEIDDVIWLPVPEARKKLSHALDRDILDQFVSRVKEGALHARPLILIRHGKAEARKRWVGTDGDRPITPKGAAASHALIKELACYAPTRLVSSPWLRCHETIMPYAWHTNMPIIDAPELTEDAFAADPDAAWRCMAQQIDELFGDEPTFTNTDEHQATNDAPDSVPEPASDPEPMPEPESAYSDHERRVTAVCMHRPVIGGIFEHLRPLCTAKSLAKQLVAKTPYMATANALVLFVVRTADGPRIIDIQRMAPLVY